MYLVLRGTCFQSSERKKKQNRARSVT
jgi:hypothetical protein